MTTCKNLLKFIQKKNYLNFLINKRNIHNYKSGFGISWSSINNTFLTINFLIVQHIGTHLMDQGYWFIRTIVQYLYL